MLTIKIGKKSHQVSFSDNTYQKGEIDKENFDWDVIENKRNIFHVLMNGKSYQATIKKTNFKEKSFTIAINGKNFQINVEDQYDVLLKDLGFKNYSSNTTNKIIAPMPGLVLEVLVKPGQTVKKGDKILVLEAMKMENIIKSPGEGIVKECLAEVGATVEKNQILINFE